MFGRYKPKHRRKRVPYYTKNRAGFMQAFNDAGNSNYVTRKHLEFFAQMQDLRKNPPWFG